MNLQSVIRAIYPAQCVACDDQTAAEHGLCASCWRETHFTGGLVCDKCGVPLPGEDAGGPVQCDDCLTVARPWDRGRAALVYSGVGRKIVLGLKHGDRLDLAYPAATWMVRAARPLLGGDMIIVPVPLHWTRLLKRRYNQAAVLAQEMAKITGQAVCVDALKRARKTKPLEGHSLAQRFEALAGAIAINPNRRPIVAGRSVLLVDDVMTSGATLAASADALLAAGARDVSVITLARTARDLA